MADKFDQYYENARPEIQGIVGSKVKKILDIGCGAGSMAYQLKVNNAAEVWGIEPVETAAKKAVAVLDKVINSSVEEAIENLPKYYFDAIIFADVLEHLVDPYTVLSKIKYMLAPDGFVVVSLPNVRHWSVIRGLLEGKWNYEDYGILDSTHLRFFTRTTVNKLFHSSGFEVEEYITSVADMGEFPKGIVDLLLQNGIDASTLEEESKHFQYIVKAYPATRKFRSAHPMQVSEMINQLFKQTLSDAKVSSYSTASENCLLAIDIIHRTQLGELQPILPQFEALLLKLRALDKTKLV